MLRLRQICLVASELRPVVEDLKAVLQLDECFHDPAVAEYGLENALLPIGQDFLEVVAPTQEGTAAGRYIERRGGDGGYIVILQCDDADRRRAHYQTLGVRIANAMDYGDFDGTQLHPKDTGGCMLEVDQQEAGTPNGPWHPAGDDWEKSVRTTGAVGMTSAIIQSQDPVALAGRWGEILDKPVAANLSIPLDNGAIKFTEPRDDRGDGLIALQITAKDPAAIIAAAKARGLPTGAHSVTIGGVVFHIS
jgi:hypothetical protein